MRLTATLNSLIIAGVILCTSTPRAGGDDAAFVGERFHALHFAGGQLHWGYYGTRATPSLDCAVQAAATGFVIMKTLQP
jgi:hypothetical protein